MPIRNHFPVFHKLKKGAYSYVWTDKCEKLLPKHYKKRCLEYMLKDAPAVHWKPDPRKYTLDKYGQLLPVQNHPISVKFPVQCNKGLWAGEGIVQCWMKYTKGTSYIEKHRTRAAKLYTPLLLERVLYSEILDKWFKIPCTNRAMDQIDDAFGLDYYILQTHERDLNSKLAMDLRREMLIELAHMSEKDLSEERQKIFTRYKKFMIPLEEAEWVGLSIKQALEKAEAERGKKPLPPLKELIEPLYIQAYTKHSEENKPETFKFIPPPSEGPLISPEMKEELKSLFKTDESFTQESKKKTG